MIHVGDCLSILPTLPERSVHCVVTSPPYFGLRSYLDESDPNKGQEIGAEPTPDAFVAAMVRVFREVKRVLRDDGTCWLNLGDTYSAARWSTAPATGIVRPSSHCRDTVAHPKNSGLPDKNLIGIPWRVAFALQADGWYLRSDIIWAKSNPMPESVRDRPTKSHEYMFLLSKSPRYYWDAEAVKEAASQPVGRAKLTGQHKADAGGFTTNGHGPSTLGSNQGASHRNIRSVWTISTRSFKGAHFAVMPPRLVEPCIKAGTSERGCCPGCGKPWVRVVERKRVATRPGLASKIYETAPLDPDSPYRTHAGDICGNRDPGRHCTTSTTTGWRPGCTCGTDRPIPEADLEADPTLIDDFEIEPFPPIPCTVLDPFAGAGTVGLVAKQLGRSFVGCELNAEYAAMAEARIAKGA